LSAVLAFQASLLDAAEEIGLRPLDSSVERTALGQGAWVDLRREWVIGSDVLFEQLAERVAWQSERRRMYDRVVDVPRLVSFYGEGEQLPSPLFAQAMAALDQHYRPATIDRFATAGLCLYRNGSDSVAWHGDTIGRGSTEDTMVAIVSLGTRRGLALRPRAGGPSRRFDVGAGDLLVMGGSCQRTFEHAVPKTKRPVGPRISVQFRASGVR
jgi:alkylated DNA repair dioxygenase AlkB